MTPNLSGGILLPPVMQGLAHPARAIVVLAVLSGTTVAAQGLYPAEVLRDLPAGGNLFAILESAQPEITTDRFNSGGLNGGTRERIGAFLASWSQTHYRIGDINISSPVDGTPLMFPELAWWSHLDASTTLMSADSIATGLAVSLVPKPPTGRWGGTVEMTGSGGWLANRRAASPPAIAALDHGAQATALAHGRAWNGRLRLMLGGSWSQASTIDRSGSTRRDRIGSLFAHSVFAIAPQRNLRALAWVQPDSHHYQATFEALNRWRFFGGHSSRSTAVHGALPDRVQRDRLIDGPIPLSIDTGGREQRWVVGARVSPIAAGRHSLMFGGDLEGTSYVTAPSFRGVVEERVNGLPARLWRYVSGTVSRRRVTLVTAFANDRLTIAPNVVVDAALRFESADGTAEGAAQGISWRTWLPSLYLHWDLETPLQLRVVTGVSRSADHPVLGLLAYGDPAAPTAHVFRWDGSALSGAPVIARVGPGTAGDPSFSAIDPSLKRPITDQFALGVESRPTSVLLFGVTGLARRQSSLIHAVNVGVPLDGYTMFTVLDANADLDGSSDDQQLPVYNRKPETFGQDRYLLTNPGEEAATLGAVVVSAELSTHRVLFRFGGTASASVGPAGNRGFNAAENDQGIPGELFTNPNASTYARGRLFNDRAYTMKVVTVVRLPSAIRLGAIARYQDGQPFSRLVIVPGLNQGPEAIQAFANGRSRFTFRTTLDLRLQKRVAAGRSQIDLIADAYNLLNTSTEVEEYVVTGPRFRETTAVQPPRALHIGARITF